MKQPEKIGRYKILKQIAKGGMGEIYLASDPLCERNIVIKKIRDELLSFKIIKKRFLKEAKIAAKLSHPSIIKIYVIHDEEPLLYYTMPHVEGETLKEILQNTKLREEEGQTPHEIGVSIPSLIRIFQTVCFAIAYSHSQGIIHRDLKPENLIIGKFGEVTILDWGIACKINHEEVEEEIDLQADPELTQPGKVLGTLNYLAPERAKGEKAHYTTDIYALGVILYQLLSLQLPFRRASLEKFKKTMHLEMLLEPSEIAPYRDIPKQLSDIAKKCLSFDPKERYQNISELLADLEQYIEGKPGWTFFKRLHPEKKIDWEFQENVLIAKHVALTRSTKEMQWFYLMLSKEKFTGNIRLGIDLLLKENAEGLGFLLCIPEPSVSKGFEEGYCIWFHLKGQKVILMRSNVEVLTIEAPMMEEGKVHHIVIEKIDDSLQCSINGKLVLNYVSHMPLFGAHLGILSIDMNYNIPSYNVFLGSYHILTNCLSIPDAFLAGKDYGKALEEYRRIGTAFEGRTEGREALFRAGMTLLEQAKSKKNGAKMPLLDQAIVEFEKLSHAICSS